MGMWTKRWENRKDARQTGIFFNKPNLKKSTEITSLSKEQIGQVVRALTGHFFRRRHNALVNNDDNNLCSMCQEAEETPSHLILDCSSITHLRAYTFRSYLADIRQHWRAKDLVAFLSAPLIAEMETDLSRENLP